MRVLFVAPGGWIHTKRPLEWLLRAGCEVTLTDDVDAFPEGRAGYSFRPYPAGRLRNLAGRVAGRFGKYRAGRCLAGAIYWLETRIVLRGLAALWKCLRPDVVHVYWVDRRAWHCAQAGMKPLVLTVLGSDVNERLEPGANPKLRRMTGKALAAADVVTADAEDMRAKCTELAGKSVRLELVHLGIDTTRFRPGYAEEASRRRRQLGISEDTVILFSIRAIHPVYNHHLVLDAFARALPHIRKPCVLVMKKYNMLDSAYGMELERQTKRLGLGGSVRWLDEVSYEEMPGLYAFADIILSYPAIDGFPVTFLETAACERPLLTCDQPAYRGTFVESFAHFVRKDDVNALAGRLVEVLNTPAVAEREALARARQVVCRDYDETESCRRFLRIYEETAGKTGSS